LEVIPLQIFIEMKSATIGYRTIQTAVALVVVAKDKLIEIKTIAIV